MNFWLLIIISVLIMIIAVLILKICLLQKSADEICCAFNEKLENDTNTLINISCRDRHMRRLANDMNKELKKLRADRRKFQQGDLELKEAVTNISHDLRTPLTAICGYLALLENEEKSPAAEEYIKIISQRAQVLKQLTTELFRYSVITSTFNSDTPEKLEMNNVLEESIAAHYALISQNNIVPDISITEKKIVCNLKKNALLRIFQNIISNAVKYSDGDLKIELKDDGEIIFSNHAEKLDEVQVGRLFDRFYTVQTADKSTGLGLSIAKMLTQQMKGSITADYSDCSLNIRIKFPIL